MSTSGNNKTFYRYISIKESPPKNHSSVLSTNGPALQYGNGLKPQMRLKHSNSSGSNLLIA